MPHAPEPDQNLPGAAGAFGVESLMAALGDMQAQLERMGSDTARQLGEVPTRGSTEADAMSTEFGLDAGEAELESAGLVLDQLGQALDDATKALDRMLEGIRDAEAEIADKPEA
jgi:hypothetical protein